MEASKPITPLETSDVRDQDSLTIQDAEQGKLWEQAFNGKAAPESPPDVYVQHLVECLSPELVGSLTPAQYQDLKKALARYHTRHLLDVRGVIPFFFTQYYFVFLFGKDRRQATQAIMVERRMETSEAAARFAKGTALLVFGMIFLSCTLLTLYVLKSFLGINLIPHMHLWELLERI